MIEMNTDHLQIPVIGQYEAWVHQRNGEVKQHRHQHQQDEEHRLDELACLFLLPQLFNTHTDSVLTMYSTLKSRISCNQAHITHM